MRLRYIVMLAVAVLAVALFVRLRKGEPLRTEDTASPSISKPTPSTAPRVLPRNTNAPKVAAETATAPAPSAADSQTSIQLRARLIGRGNAHSTITRALLGPAHISNEDLAEWQEWLTAGSTGAGAKNMLELANVREWLPATVAVEGDAFILGPMEVPAAAAYRILAWYEDHTYYWHEVPASPQLIDGVLDAGDISARSPTGLSLRFRNNITGEDQLLATIHRQVRESASALFPVIEQIAPSMADAVADAEPIILNAASENRLTPLLPDHGVTITLSTASGTEGKPIGIALVEEQVTPVELDLSEIFAGLTTDSMRLRGVLLLGETSTPLTGAQIYRRGAPARMLQQVTPSGGFVFDGIPRSKPSRFTVEYVPPETTRPLAPALKDFVFTPDPNTSGAQSVVWRMPMYRWVVLDLTPEERAFMQSNAARPFPVYVLQKRSASGEWKDTAADEFIKQENEVAVSVVEPGDYRIIAAVSPYFSIESRPATLAPQKAETHTRLATSPSATQSYQVKLVSAANGQPVTRGRIVIAGPHRSIPPTRRHPNEQGIINIGPVNAERIYVTYETPRPEPGEHVLQPEDAVNGVWEIRL